MIPNPTSKGKTSEAVILAALVKLGQVLAPIESVQNTIAARLRLEPTRNRQTWNARWARDFERIPSSG